MKQTMYSTPIVRPIIKLCCQICLKLSGWKLQGTQPTVPKYVLIGYPHTSNWDFPLALSMAFVFGFDMHWMGKASLFKSWRGPLMRWLGGIPINRSRSNNMVAQTIEAFQNHDYLIVAIPPEGTRSRVNKWKTGFYYIAHGANVPIVLTFLDYKHKVGGFLQTFYTSGNIEEDISKIQDYYLGITGKHTEKSSI